MKSDVTERLENKKLLITGGTGTFGEAVLKEFAFKGLEEIRIFSRDEKKQDDLRREFNQNNVSFVLGDVRDPHSLRSAMKGVDYVFHAAALKQVPSCEFYPIEAIKTNVLGTQNVIDAAIYEDVSKVICLSTDKAVYPVNAMGLSKAMMEKLVVASGRHNENGHTKICCTRYGNVIASRGSVVPLFYNQIKNHQPITITNPKMTRFMMTLDDAVELVLFAFLHGEQGEIFVKKSPAASIQTIADAVKLWAGQEKHPTKFIGTRHGEKLFETLLSKEEKSAAVELDQFFKIPIDSRSLNYTNYFDVGDPDLSNSFSQQEYNSHNTQQLNAEELAGLLPAPGSKLFD